MAVRITESNQEQEYIMHKFKTGTKDGFDLMYKVFYFHLLHFANSIINDEEDACDIAISALESVFLKHTQFHTFSNVKAYLFISVKNKCLKYIRYKKRFKQDSSIYNEPIPTEELIEARMVRSEFLQIVYMEIESLPPIRKQVFKLFYIDGLTITQIAKKMNMTQVAASNNKLKALNQLKRLLSIKKIISLLIFIINEA